MNEPVCPQRILKEAIGLLSEDLTSTAEHGTDKEYDDLKERIDNNAIELQQLSDALYKAGITWIKPDGTHSG